MPTEKPRLTRFHQRLTRLREAAGLSQTDAARALNVSQSTLWHWETGGTELPVHALIRLARLYGLPVRLGRWADGDPDGEEFRKNAASFKTMRALAKSYGVGLDALLRASVRVTKWVTGGRNADQRETAA